MTYTTAAGVHTGVDVSPNGHGPRVAADLDGRFGLIYERMPRRREAAQTELIGLMLGKESPDAVDIRIARREWADPDGRGERSLIDVIAQFGIVEESFTLPGYWEAYSAAIDERSENDGAPANLSNVLGRLVAVSESRGEAYAYGITRDKLQKWSAAAPTATHAAYVAWVVRKHAVDAETRAALETARGRLHNGAGSKDVLADLIPRLQAIGLPGPYAAETNGLTRAEEDAFWSATPQLRLLRQSAYSRGAGSWPTLGCTLLRVAAATPPNYQLPDIRGDYASLNPFLVVPGRSNSGKDVAMAAARRHIDVGEINEEGVNTGEGIAAGYVYFERDPDHPQGGEWVQYQNSVLWVCTEVEELAALMGRKASTLGPVIRKVWMAQQLGGKTAGREFDRKVEAHTYRAPMLINAQPGNCKALLADNEVRGGTPQRMLWLPARDPFKPSARNRPDRVAKIAWVLPAWHEGVPAEVASGVVYPAQFHPGDPGLYVIGVCDDYTDAVYDAEDRADAGIGDPLDGHSVLNRGKWAAHLAAYHGVLGVTRKFWDLSDALMAVSDHARAWMVAEEGKARGKATQERAEEKASERIAVDDRVFSHMVKKVRGKILDELQELHGRNPVAWVTASAMTCDWSRPQRENFTDAAKSLIHDGLVEREPTESTGTEGWRYRLR